MLMSASAIRYLNPLSMKTRLVIVVATCLLVCNIVAASPPRTDRTLCQDSRSKTVRAYERCPTGTVEVFALVNSGGGGYWTADGRWIGQVAPRVDASPATKRSKQDDDALKTLLDRTPNTR